MTLLAPEIVEAILTGRQPDGLTMTTAMKPFPMAWERQATAYSHYHATVEGSAQPRSKR
jgi:hypothetical protein